MYYFTKSGKVQIWQRGETYFSALRSEKCVGSDDMHLILRFLTVRTRRERMWTRSRAIEPCRIFIKSILWDSLLTTEMLNIVSHSWYVDRVSRSPRLRVFSAVNKGIWWTFDIVQLSRKSGIPVINVSNTYFYVPSVSQITSNHRACTWKTIRFWVLIYKIEANFALHYPRKLRSTWMRRKVNVPPRKTRTSSTRYTFTNIISPTKVAAVSSLQYFISAYV